MTLKSLNNVDSSTEESTILFSNLSSQLSLNALQLLPLLTNLYFSTEIFAYLINIFHLLLPRSNVWNNISKICSTNSKWMNLTQPLHSTTWNISNQYAKQISISLIHIVFKFMHNHLDALQTVCLLIIIAFTYMTAHISNCYPAGGYANKHSQVNIRLVTITLVICYFYYYYAFAKSHYLMGCGTKYLWRIWSRTYKVTTSEEGWTCTLHITKWAS